MGVASRSNLSITGVSAPYEAPENPAILLDTGVYSIAESTAQLLEAVLPRLRDGHTGR